MTSLFIMYILGLSKKKIQSHSVRVETQSTKSWLPSLPSTSPYLNQSPQGFTPKNPCSPASASQVLMLHYHHDSLVLFKPKLYPLALALQGNTLMRVILKHLVLFPSLPEPFYQLTQEVAISLMQYKGL